MAKNDHITSMSDTVHCLRYIYMMFCKLTLLLSSNDWLLLHRQTFLSSLLWL